MTNPQVLTILMSILIGMSTIVGFFIRSLISEIKNASSTLNTVDKQVSNILIKLENYDTKFQSIESHMQRIDEEVVRLREKNYKLANTIDQHNIKIQNLEEVGS